MLVIIPQDGEEGVYKRLRESEDYKGEFGKNYYSHMSRMNAVVEAAKMYIVDNFKKIEDWTEVHFELRGYGKDRETLQFGMKEAERLRRYPPKPKTESPTGKRRVRSAERFEHLEEMMKKLDDERIQVEAINDAVYDWTDGDFSIQVNNVWYNWIDHRNPDTVIEIAHFIEKQLNKE